MKNTFIICCILFLAGCGQNKEDGTENYRRLIVGDWATEPIGKTSHVRYFTLSFDVFDAKFSNRDTYVKYKIKQDSLIFIDDAAIWRILKLTNDSLIAQAYNEQVGNYLVRLARFKNYNDLVPSVIKFASSGCYGSCPSMMLQIDSTKLMHFWGINFTGEKGFYSGQLSDAQYAALVRKIHLLQVDSLQEKYEADWSDDQTMGLRIETGNKIISSAAYGMNKEPVALRLVLNELASIYKSVHLTADSTLSAAFFNDFIRNDLLQLPMPPKIAP